MQGTIVYDSRTGTTKAAARAMAASLDSHGHPCTLTPVSEADPAEIVRADLLCVGSWTQGLFVTRQHPTRETMRFIERLGDLSGKQALVFCTYKLAAGPTNAMMADALEKKGADVIGRFEYRGATPTDDFRALASSLDEQPKPSEPRVVESEQTVWALPRKLFMRTTDLTHGFQGEPSERLVSFYSWWSRFYDLSVSVDPAYPGGLRRMVDLVVLPGDETLEVGCGTGIGTLRAAETARRVVGVDMSAEMLARLEKKVRRRRMTNIETVHGPYPDAIDADRRFNSVISSFAIAHFSVELRRKVYGSMYDHLAPGGRLGLFAAQGENASTFETRDETIGHLEAAGFERIVVRDVADIYRIVTARRP